MNHFHVYVSSSAVSVVYVSCDVLYRFFWFNASKSIHIPSMLRDLPTLRHRMLHYGKQLTEKVAATP
jgi:hypothetical protein